MYEETKSSIDWKGLFLKVIIGFLIVLIGITGYKTLKGKDATNNQITTTTTKSNKVSDSKPSKPSKTFTQNMEKLRSAGEEYYKNNKGELPKTNGNKTMVTLSELIEKKFISSLTDEDGKICDGESSYVTAILENGEMKLKANLVCGNASSYSLVYMGENDSSNTTTTTTNNGSTTTTTINNSSNTGNTTTSTTCGSNCTPSVSVSTNTEVSQTISSGSSTNNNTNRYYTVTFDRNGGDIRYNNQSVKYYGTVAYPGANQKYGCTFKGWYYNGIKYDFSTPVTQDMTITAGYSCNSYDNNYYYDDNNYYYDDDNYYYDDDYEYDNVRTRTMTSTVYTSGWDERGTNSVNITHTLKLPQSLRNSNISKVRIKNISYGGPINTSSAASTYNNRHYDTFFYTQTGSEYYTTNANNLSTINRNAVNFYYNTGYKNYYSALNSGFDVTWTANSVARQCSQTFTVKNQNNLCGYGIYYTVTWEYQIYE